MNLIVGQDGVHHIINLSSLIARLVGGKGEPELATSWRPIGPEDGSWAELLSVSPTIIHTFPLPELPLGAASVLGPMLRSRRVHFLFMSVWTVEEPGQRARLAHAAFAFLSANPRHRSLFL